MVEMSVHLNSRTVDPTPRGRTGCTPWISVFQAWTPRWSGFIAVALSLGSAAAVEPPAPSITVEPAGTEEVLINPGKGWVLYGLAEWQDPRALAVGALGYHRFTWSDLEPTEGTYRWDLVENALAGWHRLGKSFAFGVMCANSHARTPYVTPKWVFDAGAAVRLIDLKDLANPYAGTPGLKAVPYFDDPIFLAKLTNFLTALGKRFDGDPRLAFLDVRSYGNWGEGHMSPFGGPGLTAEAFRHHLDLHRQAFPTTRLCVSAEAKEHAAVYDWAAAQGLAMRRDGICGNSDGREVLRAFGHAPGVFEFYGNYTWMKAQGWWDGVTTNGKGHRLTDCVERGKPSYIGLSHGGKEALEFLAAERPLIDRLANRMGYHIALTTATVPRQILRQQPATLTLTWSNDGVAPVYVPAALAVALLDGEATPVEIAWPEESHPGAWQPGQRTVETVTVHFPQAAPGTYRLAVGVVAQRSDPAPILRLATAGRTATGWYPLTDVLVTSVPSP